MWKNGVLQARRQGEVVQKLAHMIGHNVRLYDMVLQFLRTLFLRTRNVHYCTLRAELLMALHDQEVQEITNVDPCHKFTWCVDACIRERNVDTKRSREIQAFLDGSLLFPFQLPPAIAIRVMIRVVTCPIMKSVVKFSCLNENYLKENKS